MNYNKPQKRVIAIIAKLCRISEAFLLKEFFVHGLSRGLILTSVLNNVPV